MLIVTNSIKKNLLAILTTTLLLHLVGCKDLENCSSDETAFVKVKFRITTQQADGSTKVQDVRNPFDSVEMVGALSQEPQDSLKNEGGFKLPLNPNADATTFVFHRTGSQPDTLTFFYERALFLTSPQCGARQYYTLLRAETTFRDVNISNSKLKRRTEQADVEIFL